MFDFTTTTIINQATYDGKPSYTIDEKGIKINHGVKIDIKNCPIKKFQYKQHKDAVLSTATFTIPTATEETVYRIVLQLRLRGSNNFLYANDLLFKEKPLFFEVAVAKGDEGTAIATKIKAQIENQIFNLARMDGKAIITAETEGATLTLTAGTEFIFFHKAYLEIYEGTDTTNSKFVFDSKAEIEYGSLAFGNFTHLQRDIQLPSDANIRYKRLYEDEKPIEGATYDQFIIEMKADRNFTGQGAVGQKLTSVTTHVFWVNSTISDAFKSALEDEGVGFTAIV